jgi:hypothetical protein
LPYPLFCFIRVHQAHKKSKTGRLVHPVENPLPIG